MNECVVQQMAFLLFGVAEAEIFVWLEGDSGRGSGVRSGRAEPSTWMNALNYAVRLSPIVHQTWSRSFTSTFLLWEKKTQCWKETHDVSWEKPAFLFPSMRISRH